MLPFVVSCRLAQLSFVLILNIDYFLCLDYLSKDRFLGSGRSFFRRGAGRSFFSAWCRMGSFGRPKNTKAAPFRAGVLLPFVLVSIIWPSGQLFDFLGRQVCHTAFYTFLSHEMLQTLCLTADLFSTIAGLAKHFCIKPVNRRRMARGWRRLRQKSNTKKVKIQKAAVRRMPSSSFLKESNRLSLA